MRGWRRERLQVWRNGGESKPLVEMKRGSDRGEEKCGLSCWEREVASSLKRVAGGEMLFTLVWSSVERGWLSRGEMQPECEKRIRTLCWQVLALPLSEEYARELRELDADERRLALTELWSGENARDVTIEKIRFSLPLPSPPFDLLYSAYLSH